MDNKKIAKTEKEIYNSLKERVEKLSDEEAEKVIREEVKKRDYLQEGWQVDYAVERIKEKKDEPHLDAEKNEKSEEKEKFKRGWKIMILGFCVEIGGTFLFGNFIPMIIGCAIIFIGLMMIVYADAKKDNK